MNPSTKIVLVVTVVVAVAVATAAYTFFNGALAPLEQRQDTTTSIATPNVEIQAITFTGDIIIEPSASNQIMVTYDTQAPQGHLNDITTVTTNQTTDKDTTIIVAEATIENNGIQINYRSSITLKLPTSSQYNLILSTLNGNIIKPLLNNTNIVATTDNGNIDIQDANADSIEASSLNGDVNVSLRDGTLFQVNAETATGHVTYQGIAMNTTIQVTAHLKGTTTDGIGHLNLDLSSANGDVTIEYFTEET